MSSSNSSSSVLVAWNPASNQSEFIASTSIASTNITANSNNDKLQLLRTISNVDRNSTHVNKNELIQVQSWNNVSQISCLEWRPSFDTSLLAYGTNIGYTYLLHISNSEKTIIHNPLKSGKRPCSALSWNKQNPNQLAAGFENLKSEYCSLIWDLEHEKFYKTSFGESSCSLGWLSDNAATLAVGTSMGWVKAYDTRISSQQSATFSILAHPAPRPRKIKGIRPDPFNMNLFATFSDFPGDAIKIWDIRKASNTANKSNTSAVFTINPKTSLNVAEAVIDLAWSPTRSNLIVVATSLQKNVSFFSITSPSGTTSVPLSSCLLPESVKSLSWQGHEVRCNLTLLQQTEVSSLPVSSNKPSQGTSSSSTSGASLSWESFHGDETLSASLSALQELQKTNSSAYRNNLLVQAAVSDAIAPNIVQCSNKLLVATTGNFIELLPRDQIPLTVTIGGIIGTGYGFGPSLISPIHSSSSNSKGTIDDVSYFDDVCDLMRKRCMAGYSVDACMNIDVLAEELDRFYNPQHPVQCGGVINRHKDFEIFVANTKAAYKVWVWMDRFETTITDRNLTLANCGVVNIIKNNSDYIYKENQNIKFRKLFHNVLGTNIYSSEKREISKKICGWIKVFGIKKTEIIISPDTKYLEVDCADDIDLLEVIVDELFLDSFERAAAIALWHGRLDLSVNLLCRAIKLIEDRLLLQNKGNEVGIEWDAPMNIPGYLQTIQLVAMCFAGYNFPTSSSAEYIQSGNVPEAVMDGISGVHPYNNNAGDCVGGTYSTWYNMCKQVVQQLHSYSGRVSSGYLIAACQFLLENLRVIIFPSPMEPIGTVQCVYAEIINDQRLCLEDRVAFACTFLSDVELQHWLMDMQMLCAKEGRIEGLILTGLSLEGLQILQQYIDIYQDVQTVALVVSRIIDSDSTGTMHQSGGETNSHHLSGKTNVPPFESQINTPTKEWMWLNEYRSLLNKWELFIERAYLDVELGKRYRRKLANENNSLTNSGKGTARKAPSNAITPGKLKHQINKNGNKNRMIYRVPVHSGYPHFYLRCGYCGNALPVDGLQNIRPEYLRTQKNVLNCCAACSKQLPRCYVCQLYLGMVNPYLELNRVMTQKRLSADRMLGTGGSCSPSASMNVATTTQECVGISNIGTAALIDEEEEMDHNTICFGKWFFFCQHCRHGGHATCIDQWFGSNSFPPNSSTSDCCARENQEDGFAICKRTLCGVNGCDCHCILRI